MFESDLVSLPLLARGKVRDIYDYDDAHLLIVTTDRLSAYDVVFTQPVPDKGRVLNRISNFWFDYFSVDLAHHLVSATPEDLLAEPADAARAAGRSVLVRKLQPLPVEAVVRGYLIGSGWRDYERSGAVCGIDLPAGLRLADQLTVPVFTPATKAAVGAHDENIPYGEVEQRVGAEVAARIRDESIELYRRAAAYAIERGVIIADTKFEFGLDEAGRLVLIDEVLTPDSSRFWPLESYAPGSSPPSFDKQFVRDYLDASGWDHRPPPPDLPAEVIAQTAERYREAERRLLAPGL